MLVPILWLRDYTDMKLPTEDFCEKMIMSGSNLEEVISFGKGISGILAGKILKLEKHPGADKLQICTVDVGQASPVQIVTGAANVFEGAIVPVAVDGSHLPGPLHGQPKTEGGVTINKGSLRGVESFGMLCSASELGFDDKVIPTVHRDGIWILEPDTPVGKDILEALGLDSESVDFEITPNRPDCLSILGMARETAATLGTKISYPDTKCLNEEGKASDFIDVEIKAPDLCPRYTARVVKDVKIGPSPWWLQQRLMFAGMRPINNIVDITNFVMLEYGQPLHAFDIRQVEGSSIVVDRAVEGEAFVTLDGTERKLGKDMLLIKDGKKPIALAGVMGGLNSEIVGDTTTVIIESANFNKDSIRATSKKIGLRTEASSRFEKGIDPNLCGTAADRVCRLIELIGAGKATAGSVDRYPNPPEIKTINVRVDRVNKVLGTALSADEMKAIFRSLEMEVAEVPQAAEGQGSTILKVTPPTVRMDLEIEEDFIEEVARIYGYDKLPSTLPRESSQSGKPEARGLMDMARETMCALGCNEIQTYSFVSPKGVDQIKIAQGGRERSFVRIINPLGEDTSVMRTILTPNMLEVMGRNFSRKIEAARAFEIGNTFMADLLDSEALPEEASALSMGLYGPSESFYTLKGIVTALLDKFGIDSPIFEGESEYGVYHPGRCARIMAGRGQDLTELGIMGEIHPDVADNYGIDTRCYCCELNLESLVKIADITKAYKPLPKYPSTSRDIAMLVEEDIAVGAMKAVIHDAGKSLLEKVELFDIYRGKQVEDGKKSCAFSLTYRSPDKTLTDEEVGKVHNEVLTALKENFNAVLRDM